MTQMADDGSCGGGGRFLGCCVEEGRAGHVRDELCGWDGSWRKSRGLCHLGLPNTSHHGVGEVPSIQFLSPSLHLFL